MTKFRIVLAVIAAGLSINHGGPKAAAACIRARPGELKAQMYVDRFRTKGAAYVHQRPTGRQPTLEDMLTRCGVSEGGVEILRTSDARFIPSGNRYPDLTAIL